MYTQSTGYCLDRLHLGPVFEASQRLPVDLERVQADCQTREEMAVCVGWKRFETNRSGPDSRCVIERPALFLFGQVNSIDMSQTFADF